MPVALIGRKGAACFRLTCVTLRYTLRPVIKTFLHKGLKAFFESGSKAGIQPHHGSRLARQLARLDAAKTAADMNVPGWGLHPLTGQLAGHYSVTVNGNWRLTFMFEGEDAVLVDYQDYH
jgi:proteic killer suppression protein